MSLVRRAQKNKSLTLGPGEIFMPDCGGRKGGAEGPADSLPCGVAGVRRCKQRVHPAACDQLQKRPGSSGGSEAWVSHVAGSCMPTPALRKGAMHSLLMLQQVSGTSPSPERRSRRRPTWAAPGGR